jgi:pilus assembly protein FimV
MPVKTRPSPVSFALKTLTSAIACAVLLSPAANAAGLGKLTVLSSMGQPLRAEIELTSVSADEAAALTAKLAPADAFKLANIEFNPTLLSLRFAVEPRNGRQILRISSTQPVNEPFVDMLLELSWNSGRLVREYTFLLDPAELRQSQPAQVAAPVDPNARAQSQTLQTQAPAQAASQPLPAGAQSAQQPLDNARALQAESRDASRANAAEMQRLAQERSAQERSTRNGVVAPQPASKNGGAEYRVKAGDNLSRIASQLKPVDVSLDAMLVALYRANPEAFSGNNMNRLKAGQILAVPDSDALRNTGESEARGVVVAHAADFAAYRSKLAGQVAQSAPAKAAEPTQNAAGKISAKVEEHATPANESKDQLKLSKAAPVGSTGKPGVSAEDKIAKEQQVAEAAARVKELEKNVSDLEKLMAVKNKAAAEQKAAADQKAAEQKAAAPVAASAPAAASTPSSTPVIDLSKPKPKPLVKKPVMPPPQEPGFFDFVSDNMSSLGIALAAILAGLAALVVSRRRKKEAQVVPEASVLGDPGTQAHSLFAEAGGQSVDTSNSVFNSNFSPSASQLDTNEVDPVAEADVYIAYGRDAQAEEILKEALRTHPERHAVRLKLLEIYATRKDARAFEMQAGELYSLTKGQGEEWPQAVALGRSIDPDNPLYAGGNSVMGAAAGRAHGEDQDVGHGEHGAALGGAVAAAAAVAGAAALTDMELDLHHEPAAAPHHLSEEEQETAVPTTFSVADENHAEHFLDFDLGGLSFDAASDTVSTAATPTDPDALVVPKHAQDHEDNGMDFHLPEAGGMPSLASMASLSPEFAAQAPSALGVEPPADHDDEHTLDFGLDLPSELGDAPVEKVAPAPLSLDDGMDFGIPEIAEDAPPVAKPTADDHLSSSLELDDFLAEQEALDAATPSAAPAAPAPAVKPAADAPEFDLSGIDLDLDVPAATGTEPATGAGAPADEALSAIHMEMDTKLDLAIAYQEIGDKEGARELIDEVIKGGSTEQVAKANSMRALLG